MLYNVSKTVSIYLLLYIFLSKNVLFYILCADTEYQNSYDDNDDDDYNGNTENYDELEDYTEKYTTDDYDTNEENLNNNEDEYNNEDELTDITTLSPQQKADFIIFGENLKKELLLDQKSNFPNSLNITFPPNEYEEEELFRIITNVNNTNNGSGNYYSSFDTGNYGGVKTGELKEREIQVVKGHYIEKFKHNLPGSPPIDVIRNVGYIADEKGYQPFIINYTIDNHRSDTEPHYDVPFDDRRRVSKEYKAHYKSKEQFNNVQLPNNTNRHLLIDDSGNYSFGFDTQTYERAESGETIHANTENETRIVKGQYTNVVGNDGFFFVKQTIGYTADEKGFQPFVINSKTSDGAPLGRFSQINYYDSSRLAEDVSIHFKPLEKYKNAKLPTLDNRAQNKSSDGYQFSFSSDTYNRSEISEIINKGTENETLVIKGQYTEKIKNEVGEDVIRQIGYVADENGYQPFIIKSYVENEITRMFWSVGGTGLRSPPPGSPRGQSIGSSIVGNIVGQWG